MTHTLHRTGSPESLSRDYVLLFMPSKDINHVGSGPKLRRMLEICLENGAIRIGDCRLGNQYYQGGVDKLLDHVEDRAVVHGVFNEPGEGRRGPEATQGRGTGPVGRRLGPFRPGARVLRQVRPDPAHRQQHAGTMGPHRPPAAAGRPRDEHHVRPRHGDGQADRGTAAKVKSGEMTPEQGAERLFKPCMCGIFNADRAARLLTAMAEK